MLRASACRPPIDVAVPLVAGMIIVACTSAADGTAVVARPEGDSAAHEAAPFDTAATPERSVSSDASDPSAPPGSVGTTTTGTTPSARSKGATTNPKPPAAPAVSGLPVAADAPTFVIAARSPDDGNAELILLQDDADEAYAAHGPTLVHLRRDGTVEHDPARVRGLEFSASMYDALEAGMFWWTPVALGGRGPEGHYFTLAPSFATRGAEDPPQVYRRAQGQWQPLPTHKPLYDWHVTAYGPWIEDSVVALLAFTMPITGDGEEESSRPKPGSERAVAAAKPFIVLHGAPKAPVLPRRPEAFASLASGELFFAVRRDGALVVDVHSPTGTRTTTLPAIERGTLEEVALRVTAPDRALLTARVSSERDEQGFVARFDGNTWRRLDVPCVGIARSPSIDAAGDAYFTCPVGNDERGVLLRERGGVLEELPTPVPVVTVVARAADDLWVTGEYDEHGTALLHDHGPPSAPFVFPTMLEAAAAVLASQPARPLGKDCTVAWMTLSDAVDRERVDTEIASMTDEALAYAYEARVDARTEFGVLVRVWGEARLDRAVAGLRARLGDDVVATSCNLRPRVTPVAP